MHPLVLARQEAEDRRQQRRGVERVGVVVLAQHAVLGDAVLEDVGVDLGGRGAPLLLEVAVAADRGELGGAVHRHPAHQLRGDVVLGLSARLPDALVGLAPDLGGALGLGLDDRPQPARQALAVHRVLEDRVEHRAVDVVLALIEGAVADPHRAGAGVAGELLAEGLGEVAPPVDPVHDLQPAVAVGLDVGDELHELIGLPVEPEQVQRLQRERRVAHPRVAVVPVALAPGRLGQRGRQRRDGRAGRHVGQALDRQRRALDRLAPAMVGKRSRRAPASAARSGPWRRAARWRRRRRPG